MKKWWLPAIVSLNVVASQGAAGQPAITRILPLQPREGVFAYSRIDPAGRLLAYASETPDPDNAGKVIQTIRVVELKTRRLVFAEPGVDAYWSPEGDRLIFLSYKERPGAISIWHRRDGRVSRGVAPPVLGDYYSWGASKGADTILTIKSNYFGLKADRGELPARRVPPCPVIGMGDRPLISKDARLITTFVRGAIVVRSLASCDVVINTHLRGGKADFSWDARYIAFHAPKPAGNGYEIAVVDLERRTQRRLRGMQGSSLFPSWTKDGKLSFRYDGPDFRGFMLASGLLTLPESPLPTATAGRLAEEWQELFPAFSPSGRWRLVLIWASWSAHSSLALTSLQQAHQQLRIDGLDVSVLTAVELSTPSHEAVALMRRHDVRLPVVPLEHTRVMATEAMNQIPITLLFDRDELVDRRLGAQESHEIRDWVNQLARTRVLQ